LKKKKKILTFLALEKRAVTKITFVSRKSENDPSSGHFSASLERLDAPEFFIWHDKNIHWRTGPWNICNVNFFS
jgi:hypothetical protein